MGGIGVSVSVGGGGGTGVSVGGGDVFVGTMIGVAVSGSGAGAVGTIVKVDSNRGTAVGGASVVGFSSLNIVQPNNKIEVNRVGKTLKNADQVVRKNRTGG